MSQQHWIQVQMLLDQGAVACHACHAIVTGAFCRQCGASLHEGPKARACAECGQHGSGAYCSGCGYGLGSPDLDALEAGTFDWEALEADLKPLYAKIQAQGPPAGDPRMAMYG